MLRCGRPYPRRPARPLAVALLLAYAGLVALPPGSTAVAAGHVGPFGTPAHESAPSFAVNFTAAGLANGAMWHVSVGGLSANSSEPWITLSESNGTYPYQAGTGACPDAVSSAFTVAGAAIVVPVPFSSGCLRAQNASAGGAGLPGAGAPSAASPAGEPWAFTGLVAVGAIVAIAVSAVALRSRRRPRPPLTLPSSEAEGTTADDRAEGADDPLGHML